MVSEDWATRLASEIAERYCMRTEVAVEAAKVLEMIERRCPFRRGVAYVEIEGTPPPPMPHSMPGPEPVDFEA